MSDWSEFWITFRACDRAALVKEMDCEWGIDAKDLPGGEELLVFRDGQADSNRAVERSDLARQGIPFYGGYTGGPDYDAAVFVSDGTGLYEVLTTRNGDLVTLVDNCGEPLPMVR